MEKGVTTSKSYCKSHKTVVSALKMESEYDSGPIYFKEKLKLEGSAHQIFKNFQLTFKLIKKIVDKTSSIHNMVFQLF